MERFVDTEQRLRRVCAYCGGIVLMDLEDPHRILGRSGQVFGPETDYECRGFVPNVVFPTGLIQQKENLLVYYGAADTCTAVVEFSLNEVLKLVRERAS